MTNLEKQLMAEVAFLRDIVKSLTIPAPISPVAPALPETPPQPEEPLPAIVDTALALRGFDELTKGLNRSWAKSRLSANVPPEKVAQEILDGDPSPQV